MNNHRHTHRAFRLALVVALLFAVGCTHIEHPLNELTEPPEKWVHNDTRSAMRAEAAVPTTGPTTSAATDGYFVGLALSGGGSRSANFSAACMLELQRLGLLQRVDYISAVSGGSLTAAYYCSASDNRWNAADLQKGLTHPFASDALLTLAQPWTLFALVATDYDSSDIIASTFNRTLFTQDGKTLTYGDLRADRPRLLINSTDLQSGRRFVISNESFDGINTDLSRFPLAYACAASSAVPVVMHPVALRDYSTTFKTYRHFIDGGITDNLGVQTLLEVYDQQNKDAIEHHRPPPYPKGAILIVLDAKTRFNARLDDKRTTSFLESLKAGVSLTSTALLARASSATLADMIVKYSPDAFTAEKLRAQIKELEDTGYLETTDRSEHRVKIIHLDLSSVNKLKDLPYTGFGASLDNIETYFNISDSDAFCLYQAAHLLVENPPMKKHLQDATDELAHP